MPKLRHLLSFRIFCAFIITWILQVIPITGIFLMMVGASFFCGLLLLAFMIVIFIEALVGRVPRWMLLVPIIFFGGYYGLYFQQAGKIASREIELQKSNPTKIYNFDTGQEDLVTADGRHLVSAFRIPVVYVKNKNNAEGYLSYRIVTKEHCNSIPEDSEARISKGAVNYREKPRAGRSFGRLRSRKGLCLLRMPEKPTKNIIVVETKGQQIWKRKSSIEEGSYKLLKNNKVLGEYRTASVQRYRNFPIPIIGCFLNSGAPSWDCSYGFRKSLYHLKTNPMSIAPDIKINPVILMLGIAKYTDDDFSRFKEYPESAQAIKKAKGFAGNIVDEMFEKLDKMLTDPKQKIAWRMEHTLTRDPGRIAERSEQIIRFLGRLEHNEREKIYAAGNKQRLMFSLLAWLPDEKINELGSLIFDRLKEYKKLGDAPELYIRLADAADTLSNLKPYYEEHLITGKNKSWQNYLPASALCRVGKASSSTIEFMKSTIKKEGMQKQGNEYHEALFLALLVLGERDFLESLMAEQNMRYSNWYKTILDGKADGQYGPNNCMVRDGKIGNWNPSSMQRIAKKF